ncbi:hypothetical protein ASPACDRAFT_125933 [Aspergillus aculeatus ATCC 16872]|uniref:Indole-diterpene biosynthesis protein PaxU n=1 Tax=Aspergillus aculeatus (strain ATCC 16872 / CBS 172.66 / WB 5094) TaxID=690307 RepID=A0A1L9WJN7_ASPA1|nr:uncharacterized protein ASPACDRAFT_125933 [Aspergillus aculeatus ATCC 16872]OJJ96369.1 hypothetical protein ASPACDRAFT_125933 [Aspergillus aculeatus ATCC 16872]
MPPDFAPLSTRTWLSTPDKPHPGQLIIICTWLGASPKHISKYTELHRSIAPAARILLIESEVSILVSSYARQRRLIRPAVEVVLDTLAETDRGHGMSSPNMSQILLHTFSNGGTNTATQLLITLRELVSRPLPLVGLVLDSTPAKGTYWKSYNAMVFSLPPGSRMLGSVVVHCLLILLYTWIAYGNENPASLMRRTLLDEKTVIKQAALPEGDENDCSSSSSSSSSAAAAASSPSSSDGATAGNVYYMYSKADRMTHWTDVWDHAQEAQKKGWRVKQVLFEGTGHCAHMPSDPTRYAKIVEQAWTAGLNKPEPKL